MAFIAAHLNAYRLPLPHFSSSLISLVVSVDGKHHVYLLTALVGETCVQTSLGSWVSKPRVKRRTGSPQTQCLSDEAPAWSQRDGRTFLGHFKRHFGPQISSESLRQGHI